MRFDQLIFSILALGFVAACSPQKPSSNSFETRPAGVIGGSSAKLQEFPFIANIWLESPEDLFNDHLCGGSLIHPNWILTAAHCVLQDVSDKTRGLVKFKQVSVYLGSLQRSGKGGQKLTVRNILVHPDFSWPRFDVALIELNETVSDIQPVELNGLNITDFSQKAKAAGWGLTDENGKVDAQVLQSIELPLVSREVCAKDSYVSDKSWSIGPETLCARTEKGLKATCAGDSGGPLVLQKNGKPVQIGIVSWGSACRPSFQGKQSDIEGYADVAAAFSWIQKEVPFKTKSNQ